MRKVTIVISKRPLLKMCHENLTLAYGITDFNELIDTLCRYMKGSFVNDLRVIRDIVNADTFFQGFHEPMDKVLKKQFHDFLFGMLLFILVQIREVAEVPKDKRFEFVEDGSKMHLKFTIDP